MSHMHRSFLLPFSSSSAMAMACLSPIFLLEHNAMGRTRWASWASCPSASPPAAATSTDKLVFYSCSYLVPNTVYKKEFAHVLQLQSTGFSQGSSKYREFTLHKCGRARLA